MTGPEAGAADPAVVAAEGVEVRYHGGPEPAVRGVSLTLLPGDGLMVSGPAGAGKTSLLRGLLGLVEHRGALDVLGRPPGGLAARGRTGYGPQGSGFAGGLRVSETVRAALALRRAPAGTADEALARAGLQYVASWRTSRLDVEGFRRLSLALAIAGDPDLVVLDDPWVLTETLAEIRAARARGAAVVVAARRPAGLAPALGRRIALVERAAAVNALFVLTATQLARLLRRRWIQVGLAAGVALAAVAALTAIGSEGIAREDELRRSAAALLLLGGLALAIALGSAALNLDAASGHLGLLAGAGASRPQLVAGAVGARIAVLAAALVAWGVVLQAGSLALGLGLDGPLAVHTLAVAVGLLVALLACAAASSVVGPAAAGAFGVSLYVVAQAAVNLKAAADQGLIGTADASVKVLYYIAPRTITSPMLADLQLRDVAGAAAPRVEINDNTVIIPASGWDSVAWTLAWCVLLGLACAAGLRKRPLA